MAEAKAKVATLDFDRVHIYERHGGSELLIRTNLYKMFERRSDPKDKGSTLEALFAQGGHWYDRGGNVIEPANIPQWVWTECRAMSAIDRGMYRIVLPEEAELGATIPTFEEASEFPPTGTILQALVSLDPKDDSQWTDKGLPSLEAVSKIVGARVTRKRLDGAAPRFVRPA